MRKFKKSLDSQLSQVCIHLKSHHNPQIKNDTKKTDLYSLKLIIINRLRTKKQILKLLKFIQTSTVSNVSRGESEEELPTPFSTPKVKTHQR